MQKVKPKDRHKAIFPILVRDLVNLIKNQALVFTPFLEREITYIKGVGPSKSELLKSELSIKTVRDLLTDFPIRYEDRTKFQTISNITQNNEVVQLRGKITSFSLVGQTKKRRLIGNFRDNTGSLELVWFRSINWLKDNLQVDQDYIVYGRVTRFGRRLNIAHPELELASQYQRKAKEATFVPIYRSTERLGASGLDSRGRRKVMYHLFQMMKPQDVSEYLPEYMIEKLHFPSYYQALKNIHFPTNNAQLLQAEKRLKFDELFLMQMEIVKQYKNQKLSIVGSIFGEIGTHFNEFYHKYLPFELTGAQKKVLKEIRHDVRSGQQMNRLLQGDVGSGKTVVALLSMLMGVDNGFQACLMAPTEILAQQHHESLKSMLKDMPIRVGLLTGSIKGKPRHELLKLLRMGEVHFLIGTHALIEDHVVFENLGLAIIDEQHRFGVAQRAKLWKKGQHHPPHILVMTATPIPRTLHMTVYGDLDVSVIDELPPGRKPIKTLHKTEYHRPKVVDFMRQEIEKGRQIYVVYPLIEESEKLDLEDLNNGYERLISSFPKPRYQVSVLHGRMKQSEKDFEMQRFVDGITQIMVATTVIEVGVNIPNASVMIIENSERFGLSQLHQLRGRVGRGAEQSFCILMSSYKLTQEAKERLNTMVGTNDGFEIAEVDLRLRGPGSMQSTQQSGLPELKIAHLVKDNELLKTAREIAMRILDKDPNLKAMHHERLRSHLQKHSFAKRDWSKIS